MASDGSKFWTVFSLAAALGTAAVTKKGLTTTWKAATGKNPPANPADPDVAIWEAVLWATVSGSVSAPTLAKARACSRGFCSPPLDRRAARRPGRHRPERGRADRFGAARRVIRRRDRSP